MSPGTPDSSRPFAGRLVMQHLPATMRCYSPYDCRVLVENLGRRGWLAHKSHHRARVELLVEAGAELQRIPLRGDAHPGERIHFAFRLHGPDRPGRCTLRITLVGEHLDYSAALGIVLFKAEIPVMPS
jgi:hypothetical protein